MHKLVSFLVFLSFTVALVACGSSSSGPSEDPDTQAPTATAVLPMTNATNVALDTKVIAAFNEAIDPASIGSASFQLLDGVNVVAASVSHDPLNHLLTLTPDAVLAAATQYTAVVSSAITDLAGNALGANFSWTFTTASFPQVSDTTAPIATALLPMANETDVDVRSKIIVSFDEAIDPASVSANAFQLVDGVNVIAATVSHDQANNLLTLTPDAALAAATKYTVLVSSEITDLAGNALGADFSWTFTTAAPTSISDTTAPTATPVVPMSGETGVDVATKIIVAFDEAIDPFSLVADSFQLLDGVTVVAATVTHDAVNNLLVLVPDTRLAHDTSYSARVLASITDLAGNALAAEFSWNFTTRADNTIPQLQQINPVEDATNVALDVVLSARFDEPIDPASISGFGITGVTGTASLSGDGSIVQFVPDAPLANLTTYQANLPATLKDLAGNQLNLSKTWSFTTLPDQIAPRVVQTNPAEAAVIPITQQSITIEFDEAIDSTSVNASNITMTEAGQPFAFSFISVSAGNRINITVPTLTYDTAYSIQVSTAITDLVGNALAAPFVLNFSVEPDNVAPAIVGRTPGIGGRVVPPNARLQVRFSEAMDQNLISPATVNIQGVAGIVSYDNTNDTVTFIPNADLTPGQQYTAEVAASVTDLAGNPLPAADSWIFTVDGAPLQLSDDSSAGHGPARVAFGGTDGFALWSVSSGTGVKLVAARRNTSSTTFGVEQTIAEYPGDTNHLQPVIASNGTTFAAVWVRPSARRIYGSVFSAGAWSTPVDLGAAGGGTGRIGIVSNGSTYAAGWNNSFSYFASVFDGAAWTTSTLGATSTSGSGVVGPLELVSDGSSYAMSWVGRVSVFNGATWSTTQMPNTNSLQIAAGNSGYAVSWRQFPTTFPNLDRIFARVHDGTGWGTAEQLTGFGYDGRDHDIASNGAGYAVIHTSQFDSPTGDKRLDLDQFSAGSWSLSNIQNVAWNGPSFTSPQIASNGTTYAVTWRDSGALLASVNLGTTPTTLFAADVDESFLVAAGSNYFAVQDDIAGRIRARVFVNSWLGATALSSTDSSAQLPDVVVNGSGVLIGYGTDTADARMATYSTFSFGGGTSTVSANRLLVSGTHLGGVRNPVAAVNGAGDSMIIWEQFDAGVWQVRGRSFRNGSADPVRVIATSGQSPDIAADAASFMIVWEDNREVFARRYSPATNTLSTSTLLGAANLQDKPSVASNGSSFLAGWTESRNVLVAEFIGIWGTPLTLFTDNADFQEDAVVASSSGEYAIIWIEDRFSSDVLHAQVRSAGSWGPRTQLDFGNSISSHRLLSNGTGYAAVYRDGSNTTARVFDGGTWSIATNLGFGGFFTAATDGSEYRVLFGSTTLDERVFSAGAWSDRIDSNLRASALASDGAGFALLGVETNGNDRTLFSASRSVSGWSDNLPLLTLTDATFGSVVLDSGAETYLPLWTQPALTETIAQRLWLIPDN